MTENKVTQYAYLRSFVWHVNTSPVDTSEVKQSEQLYEISEEGLGNPLGFFDEQVPQILV